MEFGFCRRRKIWIPAAKFDEFCKRKFVKRRILFFAVFVVCMYVDYSLIVTIIDFPEHLAFEIRATLYCSKFTTLLHHARVGPRYSLIR